MAGRKIVKHIGKKIHVDEFVTKLKVGDSVMVITGGNKKADKVYEGKVGKVMKFYPKTERVLVDGVKFVARHKRATSSTDSGGKIIKPGTFHISNLMFYSDELKRPVRLRYKFVETKKVRYYVDPKTKAEFQIG
jgi:large subunit ribosomal protein L24